MAADDETRTLWAGPPGWGTRAEIDRSVEHLVTLAPIEPPAPQIPQAPTPLDAVTQAVTRATRDPRAGLRVRAAQIRTAIPTQNRASATGQPHGTSPATGLAAPRHRR